MVLINIWRPHSIPLVKNMSFEKVWLDIFKSVHSQSLQTDCILGLFCSIFCVNLLPALTGTSFSAKHISVRFNCWSMHQWVCSPCIPIYILLPFIYPGKYLALLGMMVVLTACYFSIAWFITYLYAEISQQLPYHVLPVSFRWFLPVRYGIGFPLTQPSWSSSSNYSKLSPQTKRAWAPAQTEGQYRTPDIKNKIQTPVPLQCASAYFITHQKSVCWIPFCPVKIIWPAELCSVWTWKGKCSPGKWTGDIKNIFHVKKCFIPRGIQDSLQLSDRFRASVHFSLASPFHCWELSGSTLPKRRTANIHQHDHKNYQ